MFCVRNRMQIKITNNIDFDGYILELPNYTSPNNNVQSITYRAVMKQYEGFPHDFKIGRVIQEKFVG